MAVTRHEKVINQLFTLASDHPKVAKAKIAAALVYKNDIIAYGFNQYKDFKFAQPFKKNPHKVGVCAEVDCIRNAYQNMFSYDIFKKSTLYVVRSKMTGSGGDNVWGIAKPCAGCERCISFFGIKKVYYTTDEGTYEQL